MESAEKNKELVRRAVEEVWNGAQYHKALEFVSRDFVVHFGSTDDEIRGVDGISRFFGELRTAFPDFYFAIQDQVAEHDKVVTYYTASGTHTGVFKGIPPTGTENYGGPLVTKGGLIFIASTKDSKIRAFDKKTGKVLWEAELPVPGYATPSTYMVNGKQYVVIACGGGKIGSKSGDQYIAFALP